MRWLVCGVLTASVAWSGAAAAQTGHPCARQAREQALKLLHFHSEGDGGSVDDAVRKIGTVRSLRGKSTFDVLEVAGYLYKAEYRLRLIYFAGGGSCALMGQEVLERSDPG